MERVGTLINKLKEQFDQQADAEKMAITAQLILAELTFKNIGQTIQGNVSVVLPRSGANANLEGPISANNDAKSNSQTDWIFENTEEIPTLSFQNTASEPIKHELKLDFDSELPPLNELYQLNAIPVINDQLKEERVEVAAKLDETPIRDLRKAISVNDKYLFAHVLFRGDESMYERSIKTINSFSIYPEAQYWIQRELKVKLGWEDSNETVKLFDHLVKRRFS
jgi:hypothetical protein